MTDIFAGLESDDVGPGKPDHDHHDHHDHHMAGQLTDAAAVTRFAQAGNARLTLRSKKTGTRFTYRVRAPEDGDGSIYFVAVLTGEDNNSSYSYLGFIRRGVYFHGNRKAKVGGDAPSAKAFAWAWAAVQAGRLPELLEVWHEGRCGRCGRALTVPESVASGFGPECAEKIGL